MKTEEALVLGAGAIVAAGSIYYLVTREAEAEEPEVPEEAAGSMDFMVRIE